MNCFYIFVYVSYHKNCSNHSFFGVFFSSALANVVMYYMLITIDLLCFIVDGAVSSVSYEMSSFTESLPRFFPHDQAPLPLPLNIHPTQIISSLPLACRLVWIFLWVNSSVYAQHSLFESHLAPDLLWSRTELSVGCAVSIFIFYVHFALVGLYVIFYYVSCWLYFTY